MDPNSLQYLPGMAYIDKLQSAQPSAQPFAEYDRLTPDEPAPIWQSARNLINSLRTTLAAQAEKATERTSNTDVSLDRVPFIR